MNNDEETVVETTENVVEQATEELVDGSKVSDEKKVYTQAEIDKMVNEKVNNLLPKKLERAKDKISREFENRYEKVNRVLKAGLGVETLDEATEQLEQFYTKKGVKIPERSFTESDEKYLAEKYASEVIDEGYEAIVNEVDKLASLGDKMTSQQKVMFMKLAGARKEQEEKRELASIGVSEKELDNAEFKSFTSKLSPNLTVKEKYEMYKQFKPKPSYEQIGSMKSDTSQKEIKDFYTYEESLRFTKEDFDKNPKLFEAVEKSMSKW